MRRTYNHLLIGLFLLAIGLPGVALLAGLRPDAELGEKRTLAPLPDAPADGSDIERYPREFEAYFSDHFGFRTTLVRSYNEVFGHWLRPTDDDVIYGKEGWLYYRDTALRYRRARAMDAVTLSVWVQTLKRRHEWLAERGIEYVFLVTPNKDTIHPEYLPDYLARRSGDTLLDQLLRALRERTEVRVVDLREPMLEAKTRFERLYHPADTHWNDFGAYVGYAALVRDLAGRYRTGPPIPLTTFRQRQVDSLRDLADMLGVPDQYPSQSTALELDEPTALLLDEPRYSNNPFAPPQVVPMVGMIEDPALPRAVVFRDSFGSALIPFLSEHFSRVVYIWSEHLDGGIVEAERPDVVITEMNERKLIAPPPEDSDHLAGRSLAFRNGSPVLSIEAGNARAQLEGNDDLEWIDGTTDRLEARGKRPIVELPAFAPGERVLVRIVFECPDSTWSRLYYGSNRSWGFTRERSLRRYVSAGTHEFYFEIPPGDFDGRLAFSPGRAEGEYRIEAIEVRRLPREPVPALAHTADGAERSP